MRCDKRGAEENHYQGGDLHRNDAPGCAGKTGAGFPGLVGVTANYFDGKAKVPSAWAIPTQDGLLNNQEAIRSAWRYTPGNAKEFINEPNIDETRIAAYAQVDFSSKAEEEKQVAGGFVDGRVGARLLHQNADLTFPDPDTGDTANATSKTT